MGERCSCCGKELGVLNFAFRDGKACEECFKKICSLDRNTTGANFRMHTGAEIRAILDGSPSSAPQPATAAPQSAVAETPEEPDATSTEKKAITAGQIIWLLVKIAVGIVAAILIFNYFNSKPYIEMVKEAKPYDTLSYGAAFDAAFDSNKWSYLKSDGKKFVQVESSGGSVGNVEVVTRFLLTPHPTISDRYFIEPYAVWTPSSELTEFGVSMFILALFEGNPASVLLQ